MKWTSTLAGMTQVKTTQMAVIRELFVDDTDAAEVQSLLCAIVHDLLH